MHLIRRLTLIALTSIIWLSLLSPSFAADPHEPPTILIGVTPQGENVEPPSQIVFQFSNPVVALGRMERSATEITIVSNPQLPCEWRWLNTSALACNLAEKDLPKSATRYVITIPKAFDRTRGETLREDVSTSFVTQRPSVSGAWFKTWSSPTKPVLVVSQRRCSPNTSFLATLTTQHTHFCLSRRHPTSTKIRMQPLLRLHRSMNSVGS